MLMRGNRQPKAKGISCFCPSLAQHSWTRSSVGKQGAAVQATSWC